MKKNNGFTLLEILLVIGIIAILAAVVIIAINPGRQLSQARNAQRWSNVNTILNAVHQYAVDNSGNLPSGIVESAAEICRTDAGSCNGLLDLDELTDDEVYLVSIPIDPSCSSGCGNGTGYSIQQTSNGRITVSAPDAELEQTISVTR